MGYGPWHGHATPRGRQRDPDALDSANNCTFGLLNTIQHENNLAVFGVFDRIFMRVITNKNPFFWRKSWGGCAYVYK